MTSTLTEDDEVLFALKMSLEHDERHQALALRTWLPRIEEWQRMALSSAGGTRGDEAENAARFVWLVFYRQFTDKQWAKLLHMPMPEFVATIDAAKVKLDKKLGLAPSPAPVPEEKVYCAAGVEPCCPCLKAYKDACESAEAALREADGLLREAENCLRYPPLDGTALIELAGRIQRHLDSRTGKEHG